MPPLTLTTTQIHEAENQPGTINLLSMVPQPDYGFRRGRQYGTLRKGLFRVPCYDVAADGVKIRSISEILTDVRHILDPQVAYLELTKWAIDIGIYMLGNNDSNAYLLLACSKLAPRRKARDFIESTSIPETFPSVTLKAKYPGLLLADYTRLPLKITALMAGPNDIKIPANMLFSEGPIVYYERLVRSNPCGLPILFSGGHSRVSSESEQKIEPQRSTLGGIIQAVSQDGQHLVHYGLTTAHTFTQIFHVDDQLESDDDSELNVEGDLCMDLEHFQQTLKDDVFISSDLYGSTAVSIPLFPGSLYALGRIIISSLEGTRSALDWALVNIQDDRLKLQNVIEEEGYLRSVKTLAFNAPPAGTAVISVTGSNGYTRGFILGSPILVKWANQSTCQEMWIASMDIVKGDSGSWVVDSANGSLYGHIVAANPELRLAYIVPAFQIFADIELLLNQKISLPPEASSLAGTQLKQTIEAPQNVASSVNKDLVGPGKPLNSSDTMNASLLADFRELTTVRTENSKFVFLPLNPAKMEIRLIQLLPAEWDEPIKCKIVHASLLSRPIYKALSHAWEASTHTKSITIDSSEIMIMGTLEAALRGVRDRDQQQTLWVDNICTNIDDLVEYSTQFWVFRSVIFSMAADVIVWLGDDNQNRAETAFRDLRRINSAEEFLELNRSSSGEDMSMGLADVLQNSPSDAAGDSLADRVLGSIRDLVARPWWRSVWTIQDIVHAQRATLLWGGHSLPWHDCTKSLLQLSRCVPTPGMLLLLKSSRLESLDTSLIDFLFGYTSDGRNFQEAVIRASYYQNPIPKYCPLLQLLTGFWSLESLNKKDKVYAIQCLVSPERRLVVVDYNNSKAFLDVYADTVCACIADSGDFEVLELAMLSNLDELGQYHNSYKELRPSWVPDWTREGFTTMIEKCENIWPVRLHKIWTDRADPGDKFSKRRFNASPRSSPKIIRTNGLALQISASLIDRVKAIDEIPRMSRVEEIIDSLYGSADYGVETNLGAFYRTKTAAQRAKLTDSAWLRKRDLVAWKREFATSEQGRSCLVPLGSTAGDMIYIFEGGRVPVILRSINEHFIFIGEAYVHGIMLGEVWEDAKAARLEMIELW